MSAVAVDPLGFSFIRDQRHKRARSAGDIEDWLAWLELGGTSPRTLADYEWAIARYKRGCRCDACRAGNRDYQRALKERAA